MPGITGRRVAYRALESSDGQLVPMEIIAPDDNPFNVRQLRFTSTVWQRQAALARAGSALAGPHAYFAADVAFLAAANLGDQDHYELVAQDLPGTAKPETIYGLTLYRWDPRRKVWHLDFQTTRPHDQPGWPAQAQVRGVGTLLLQAAASEMAKQDCTTVELETLDAAAERFWRARGFEGTTEPLKLQCPRLRELAKMLESAPVDPEAGTWVAAGKREELEAVHPLGAPGY